MTEESSHLHSVVDQDGAAILDIDRGLISTLNATGAYVWQGLERGELVETIVANLARESGQDPAVVDLDVRDFLSTLKREHLLPH